MEVYPRRLLLELKSTCDNKPYCTPPQTPPRPPQPQLPLPPPRPLPCPPKPKTFNQQTVFLFVLAAIAAVSFGIAYAFIAKYYFKRMAEIRRRRRRNLNPPVLFNTQEDFEDEDNGPLDHHIWYINTIGLPQSVIDSIAVFKYKREEGLIEGTECSVCLNEFSEDESLRLLPKCSHAFHLPCIDTWLRSHKNCPVCRAPVVRDRRSSDDRVVEESNAVNVSVSQENMSGDSIREGTGTSSNPVYTPSDSGAIKENLKKGLKPKSSKSCELVGNELLAKRVAMEAEIQRQPIRRSASMNAPIGSIMNQRTMDNIVLMKNSKATSSAGGNRNGGSTSGHRSTRSYSFGPSLQKDPVSMKRSSSSGKIWSSRQWRSQNIQISL